ncbi:MAG: YIP1 family protein [Chitinophagaceae bacterium]|nr:MAG: YIP1 family protein [Chitinophagaceae bacterium]
MELNDREVFSKIWLQPRKVFQFINRTGYSNHFYLLLFISGIISGLQRKFDKGIEQDQVVSTIVVAAIFGGLFGWLGTYIYASLISLTGTWISGKAKTHRIFRMLAYANIPFACSIFIYIIQLYLIKYNITSTFSSSGQIIIHYGLIAAKVIFVVWTAILYVIGIAEVQEFSIGKAILNLMAPVLLFVIPIALLLLYFSFST